MKPIFTLAWLLSLVSASVAAVPVSVPEPVPQPGKPVVSPTERAMAAENSRVDRANRDLIGRLSTASRTRDPFGLGMTEDLIVTPLAKELSGATENKIDGKPMPPLLSDVVRVLKITGLDAAKRQVFIGARTVRQGDQLKLRNKGFTFDVLVLDITPSSVVYEDTQTKNRAVVRLNIIPEIQAADPEF